MQHIKSYIFERFQSISILGGALFGSVLLLMFRMKLAQSYFYLFLVWNIFLACIPFAITFYLAQKKEQNSTILFGWFCLWVLFLPNAPYLLTDYLHLNFGNPSVRWLDIIMLASFSICGLLFYFFSVKDMECILKTKLSTKLSGIIIWLLPFTVGFGIYLGRILRWNSWNILQNPKALFNDIWNIIWHPSLHVLAWLYTFSFGIGLGVAYILFKRIRFLQPQEIG